MMTGIPRWRAAAQIGTTRSGSQLSTSSTSMSDTTALGSATVAPNRRSSQRDAIMR
jgi:hypothetical protein